MNEQSWRDVLSISASQLKILILAGGLANNIRLDREFMSIKSEDRIPDSLIKANRTPLALRCGPFNCPAVYELKDGNILIVGKKTDLQLEREIEGKVGPDEHAVVIARNFFTELFPESS
jgi:hypothetical protein